MTYKQYCDSKLNKAAAAYNEHVLTGSEEKYEEWQQRTIDYQNTVKFFHDSGIDPNSEMPNQVERVEAAEHGENDRPEGGYPPIGGKNTNDSHNKMR